MKESLQVSYLGQLQLGEGDRQGELELGERERDWRGERSEQRRRTAASSVAPFIGRRSEGVTTMRRKVSG